MWNVCQRPLPSLCQCHVMCRPPGAEDRDPSDSSRWLEAPDIWIYKQHNRPEIRPGQSFACSVNVTKVRKEQELQKRFRVFLCQHTNSCRVCPAWTVRSETPTESFLWEEAESLTDGGGSWQNRTIKQTHRKHSLVFFFKCCSSVYLISSGRPTLLSWTSCLPLGD